MNVTTKVVDSLGTFFTLSTLSGICVEISTLGASITRLVLPDRKGNLQNVVLTLADKEDYCKNTIYAGAVLGPNAGRISNATLSIKGKKYSLTANDGSHNLHGGIGCVSFHNWNVKNLLQEPEKITLQLETALPDGQDGFPGNRSIIATYTLFTDDTLDMYYTATTDISTYINLSNHTYFNLSGDFTKDALSQKLQINAAHYVSNDAEHLPSEICSVEHTPFDFRCFIPLNKQIQSYPKDAQLEIANGYNNGFSLSHLSDTADAMLYDSLSGRKVELYTDAPCLVLYSGGYLPIPSNAIALEAQDFPNAPNSSLFPCHFLVPGETVQRRITLRFRCC